MVKITREGENPRKSPRIASFASTRSKKEERIASQFFLTTGSMKGDTSVDPTELSKSKFTIPSKQPALTLVALAAAGDPCRQLPGSQIASENQIACKKPTSSTDRITFSSSTASEYIPPYFSDVPTPAQDSVLFSIEPALARNTGEET